MAAPTPQEMLDKYLEAELALLDGQTIQWGSRTLTRSNLFQIREGREYWERRVARQTAKPYGFARLV